MSFEKQALSNDELLRLKELGRLCRADILKMTYIAGSGHPGGSFSSVDILLVLYSHANLNHGLPEEHNRDRIVISHGHIAPAVYSVLSRLGFWDESNHELILMNLRHPTTPLEGHVIRELPGIDWSSGSLGQGLSAGCGFALAAKIKGKEYHTFVVASDGEQAKGQNDEGRRFAKKYKLNNLTVVIDYNNAQICGPADEIMYVNIRGNYLADGWKVLEVDGHSYSEVYSAIRTAVADKSSPYAIICRTVMGKGVSFMEKGGSEYHGRALTSEELNTALAELGIENDIESLRENRGKILPAMPIKPAPSYPQIELPEPVIHSPHKGKLGVRDAFGSFLKRIGELNRGKVTAFDCDLMGSVRLGDFARAFPDYFFESGVQEHSTATIAGALSCEGVVVFWADFGVFNIDEVYNQLRLNDLNNTNLRLISTHIGIDVGADGKTHHCIDYVGLLRNLYGFRIIIPADANEAEHIFRYIADKPGNWFIGMGREKVPIITAEEDTTQPFFGRGYRFEYGRATLVRKGDAGSIISMGTALHSAIRAWEILAEEGIRVNVYSYSSPAVIDDKAIRDAVRSGFILVVEDHNISSGLACTISRGLVEFGLICPFRSLGVTDYAPSGTPGELYRLYNLHPEGIAKNVRELLNKVNH